MVNILFIFMFIIGLLYAIFTGRVNEVSSALLDSPKDALLIFFSIASMIIFWSGILNICVKSGLLFKITKYIKKIIYPLFKTLDKDSKALDYIACNFACNLLGIGSAATPFGLKAMEELQKINEDKKVASKEMITFVVLNVSGLCLIPTSIIGLRSSYGSENGGKILVYLLLISFICTIFSVTLNEVFKRVFK